MIISKTPFRLSLFGGGTDFPSYYLKNGGCVVGGTINKYCYVTARYLPNVFDYKHRIVWSRNETVNNYKQIYKYYYDIIDEKQIEIINLQFLIQMIYND